MTKGHMLQYLVDDPGQLSEVRVALEQRYRLLHEAQQRATQTYYDTFDWRLHLAGRSLAREANGRVSHLVLSDQSAETLETQSLPEQMPRFYWDLPAGAMRDSLKHLSDMRMLIPVVEIKRQITPLRLLNRDQKTILRINLELLRAQAPGKSGAVAFAGRICLIPVRGYQKHLERVAAFLQESLQLQTASGEYLGPALSAIGRSFLDYSSKLDFSLSADTPSQAVLKEIGLNLLYTLERNLPGTKEGLDTEFLHDLRVAVRRTRSLLGQLKGVIPEQEAEQAKQGFSWLGQVTSPTRDMDVYLLGFSEYQNSLPKEVRNDLEPLRDFLSQHRQEEHQILARKLYSPHCRKILKQWRQYLESDVEPASAPFANRPIGRLVKKRIYKLYCKIYQEGSSITDESPAEQLHDLRKRCKKLRYMLEFFQSLYPASQVKPLIKALKQLLNNLGDFQDFEVQAGKLREFAHQMTEQGGVPADTLLAMGMLVDGLLKRQQQARLDFAVCFQRFAVKQNRQRFERLFAAKGKQGSTG